MKGNTFQEHLLHGSKRCFVKCEIDVLHFGWEAMLSESIEKPGIPLITYESNLLYLISLPCCE